jgi:hypothetical protein
VEMLCFFFLYFPYFHCKQFFSLVQKIRRQPIFLVNSIFSNILFILWAPLIIIEYFDYDKNMKLLSALMWSFPWQPCIGVPGARQNWRCLPVYGRILTPKLHLAFLRYIVLSNLYILYSDLYIMHSDLYILQLLSYMHIVLSAMCVLLNCITDLYYRDRTLPVNPI